MKILIVDDSNSARGLVASYLEPFGECDQAANGREAVELFAGSLQEHKPYDLIIMDVVMPEMDGIEAMRAIRGLESERGISENARSRIVTLSSRTDPEHMLTAQLECQADTYITKPFDRAVLMEAITNLGLALSPPR